MSDVTNGFATMNRIGTILEKAGVKLEEVFGNDPRRSEMELLAEIRQAAFASVFVRQSLVNTPVGDSIEFDWNFSR